MRIPAAEGDVDASRLKDCVPEEGRIGLDKLMRCKMTSVGLAQRARIILPSADRMRNCGNATMVWWSEFRLLNGVGISGLSI
ncbi:MAG: hypothetical protein IPP22_04965 [Nitrosomonas sp.]|nr:hypothetical protein [Nitrosomonas sp.]